MSQPVTTPNLSLVVPGDETHNAPWGPIVKLLSDAITAIDNQIIAGIQNQSWVFAVDTGSANAYAAAFTPAPTLQAGLRVYVKCIHANTGASTLAINGGSAKAITKGGTSALAGGEISANQIVQLVYDGTEWQLISQ